MNIILVGFMACGKSSVGRYLAEKTGMTVVDLDNVIVEKAGMSIPEIFETVGEKAFRDLESYCVSLTASMDNCIISTGGGAILREQNREALKKNGFVVWLETTPENVFKYTQNRTDRPLLANNQSIDKIQTMMAEREPLYKDASHHSIKGYEHNLYSIYQEITDVFTAFKYHQSQAVKS